MSIPVLCLGYTVFFIAALFLCVHDSMNNRYYLLKVETGTEDEGEVYGFGFVKSISNAALILS